jgi:hypothetical protein
LPAIPKRSLTGNSAYQSGREFDDTLPEQLHVLPEFVVTCDFQNVKAPGFEADDSRGDVAAEGKGGVTVWHSPISH